jgi:hypothetical protein
MEKNQWTSIDASDIANKEWHEQGQKISFDKQLFLLSYSFMIVDYMFVYPLTFRLLNKRYLISYQFFSKMPKSAQLKMG